MLQKNMLRLMLLILFVSCSNNITSVKTLENYFLIAHSHNVKKKIEIYLRRPSTNTKLPLIIFIHGHQENKSLGGKVFLNWGILDKWSEKGVVAASISQPGYGKSDGPADFCGPLTQSSIIERISFLSKKQMINTKKIFLVGISRGANVASMVATKVQSIKGLVLVGGSYDLVDTFNKLSSSSPLKQLMVEEISNKKSDLYDRSALYHVEKIKSDTLIIHGKYDTKSPVNQAQSLYQKLHRIGRKVDLILFDSGHRTPIKKRNHIIEKFLGTKLNLND